MIVFLLKRDTLDSVAQGTLCLKKCRDSHSWNAFAEDGSSQLVKIVLVSLDCIMFGQFWLRFYCQCPLLVSMGFFPVRFDSE